MKSSWLERVFLLQTLAFALLPGCASPPVFPEDVLKKVDRTVTFAAVQSNPNAYKGSTIELGGVIVESRPDGDEIRILVRELPIRTEPVYGPVDTGKLRGMYVVAYRGEMTGQDVQNGNMLVVVGTVLGAVQDRNAESEVKRPTIQAE